VRNKANSEACQARAKNLIVPNKANSRMARYAKQSQFAGVLSGSGEPVMRNKPNLQGGKIRANYFSGKGL